MKQPSAQFERSRYSFDLPNELIADAPLSRRVDSRLLVVDRASKKIEHRYFYELPDLVQRRFQAPPVFVVNDTKVWKARFRGQRVGTGGAVEFFALKRLSPTSFEGLMKSSARIAPGFRFVVGNTGVEVRSKRESSREAIWVVDFEQDPATLGLGEVPLPPYIIAKRAADQRAAKFFENEIEAYNTVFADPKEEGSVAAPTAGRHFDASLIERLVAQGCGWETITLHVGIGTFLPVKAEDIRDHQMHPELATIQSSVAERLVLARSRNRKVIAVGTTSARTLEGFQGKSGSQDLDLFIHPGSGHRWSQVDSLLTNFHLPESTLIMMISDFIGSIDWTLEIYREAIAKQYRFYSYGDAMLIL